MSTEWRKCSACKKTIFLGGNYYICSISSCNKKSRPTQYCSPSCWDAHNAVMRHKDAGALKESAPQNPDHGNLPKIIRDQSQSEFALINEKIDTDVLVVVSKVKKYIFDKSQMNTSTEIMDDLTSIIIKICNVAIANANREGRKTVLKRDMPELDL